MTHRSAPSSHLDLCTGRMHRRGVRRPWSGAHPAVPRAAALHARTALHPAVRHGIDRLGGLELVSERPRSTLLHALHGAVVCASLPGHARLCLHHHLHLPTTPVSGYSLANGHTRRGRDRHRHRLGRDAGPVRRNIGDPLLAWKDRAPGPFYAVLFLVTFEVAVLGADARNAASHLHAFF